MTQNITQETISEVESVVREWVQSDILDNPQRSGYIKSKDVAKNTEYSQVIIGGVLPEIEWLEEWSTSHKGGMTYRVLSDKM
jgi:hypothetical protein